MSHKRKGTIELYEFFRYGDHGRSGGCRGPATTIIRLPSPIY